MKTHDCYRMLITPLSPVHIGTGESYEPTNYVIEDEILHEFDTGSVIEALSSNDRKALLDITDRRPDTEMIKSLQRYFYDRRDKLVPRAVNRIPVLPGVANFYANRIGQTANREAGGGQVLNRMEIDRTSYNPITRLPLLFGSSLKGAIRTALLDGINEGAKLGKFEDRRTGRRRDENNLELQQRLFQYRAGKFELDPMRLVQLSDAVWQGEPELPAAQVQLAVNRKKAPVKDQRGNLRKAKTDELYQILECIPGWRYRAFSGQLNLQSVVGIADQNKNVKRQLPAGKLRFDIADIARNCNDFYKPILMSENKLMRDRDYLDKDWDKSINQILEMAKDRMQSGEVFLLRVGRHSGAESVTLNGVRNIKIMKGRGEKPDYLNVAKTLWLAAETKDQPTSLLPFGWLLVELQTIDTPCQEWSELKKQCEPYLAAAHFFAEKIAAQQAKIEQARLGAEAKQLADIEQNRLRLEEEERHRKEAQRQAAEREASLAKLDPIERSIHEFLHQRPDKKQSEVSAVIGAVKQGQWQGEDKISVALWLKTNMQHQKGAWKETSSAKRPEKDKEFQNTQLVKKWLEGK